MIVKPGEVGKKPVFFFAFDVLDAEDIGDGEVEDNEVLVRGTTEEIIQDVVAQLQSYFKSKRRKKVG